MTYEDLIKQMCSDHCVHNDREQFKDIQTVKIVCIRKGAETNGQFPGVKLVFLDRIFHEPTELVSPMFLLLSVIFNYISFEELNYLC